MYVQQSSACNIPNSETPMKPAAIARQNARVDSIGKIFTDGNAAMAGVIALLTPPVAAGSCEDLTDSRSMVNSSPFPWPVPAGALPAAGSGASRVPSTTAAAGVPAELSSSGWAWTKPGGGSTYPWGPTQNAASRLIPPWACAGPGGAAEPLDNGWVKWGALGLGVVLLLGFSHRGNR